jgi:cysteinyl-tRNA synthetase
MTRQLETFEPREKDLVRVYTCGPTVYNFAHIGNLRTYLFADTLRRVLQWKGYNVLHVVNITDVGHLTSDADTGDDKVEMAARGTGNSVFQITENYTNAFFQDLASLNIRPAAVYPRATQHIQEMIAFNQVLEQHGLTYELKDGLYFDTSKVPDYGKLGGLDAEAQIAGARVAADPDKRNPTDFSIWRRSPSDQKRLMEWHSPWGTGFPGWHLECSVMSLKYLDGPFDIHTGGVDHRQLHHPNEVAQNQGFLGTSESGASYWMHAEFLIMRDAKMSKSSGDFWRMQKLIDAGVHPLVYRYFLLQAHYRSQVDFSMAAMAAAHSGFARILRRVRHLLEQAGAEGAELASLAADSDFTSGGPESYLRGQFEDGLSEAGLRVARELDSAVSDDLGTPKVMALLSAVLTDKKLDPVDALRLVGSLDLLLGLKLLTLEPGSLMIRPVGATLTDDEVHARVQQRERARGERDFKRADEVRDELGKAGIILEDEAGGTTWSWRIG